MYFNFENDIIQGVTTAALQDHDGNITQFVKIAQSDIDKTILINRITSYLIDENFPVEHLDALSKIVFLFNDSEDSERRVFEFADRFFNEFSGPDGPEPDNETDLQEFLQSEYEATDLAKSLNIDAAVRVVAKSGKNHDQGPNWYALWGNMEFSATFGAGTNSATVSVASMEKAIDHMLLYHANEYGRDIETFRTGPWVNRLIGYAKELRQANKDNAQKGKAAEAARMLANFKEVDF